MNHKARKIIAALAAVVISISAFTLSAFGEEVTRETPAGGGTTGQTTGGGKTGGTPAGGTDGTGKTTEGTTNGGKTTGGTTAGGTTTGKVGRESNSGNITVVFNLDGGYGLSPSKSVDNGSKVGDFIHPQKKGYVFNGWMINGTEVSNSMPLYSDTTLTAEWVKAADASSTGKSSETASTNQKAVEQAARDAEDAGSDPGTLSSEDWGALLNPSSPDSSEASEVSSAVSSQAPQAGGTSTLFIVGIVLAVLGLIGIGIFIYLQFIHKPGGPNKPNGTGGTGDDDTTAFTNVSSYSDGRPHTADTDELHKAQAGQLDEENPVDEKTQVVNLPDSPAPAPEAQPQSPKQEAKHQAPRHLAKAQAKPVQSENSDFDWEQFFNEEDKK